MTPPTYYLRVEGVNLGRFVFDTRDLSTIRGGGLMLLSAVETAKIALQKFAEPDEVETISQGASIGLFRFQMPEGNTTDDAETVVRAKLEGEYPHATFVVAVIEAAAFRTDSEKLLARNRWRQLQSATLAIPNAIAGVAGNTPACEYDGVRPARQTERHRGRNRKLADGTEVPTYLSESTKARSTYGRDRKQNFYEKLIEDAKLPAVVLDLGFANEFEEIAARSDRGSLHGKLAVFYADGNQFGKIQRALCDSPEKQKKWDEYIRKQRAKFLHAFLDDELAKPASGEAWLFDPNSNEPRYRFETLLWGGDELLFVMPAWQGWRFAERFFRTTAMWNAKDAGLGEKPLTHTAALIFCQHHSPIHRIKDLAKEKMAESAKELPGGRERNQLVYQVLESMDHLGTDYAAALAKKYDNKAGLVNIVLASDGRTLLLHEKLGALATNSRKLRDADFPRSQLRSLVTDWIRGNPTSFADALVSFTRTEAATEAPLCELASLLGDGKHLERDKNGRLTLDDTTNKVKLAPHLGDGLPLWLHIEELWDYASPLP